MLGTGGVGFALATAWQAVGHDVVVGARTADHPRLIEWRDRSGGAGGSFAEVAPGAEVVVAALPGMSVVTALAPLAPLADTVLLDVSNPLDFDAGFPPHIQAHADGRSTAELLQEALPGASVVKALNTVTANVMVDPGVLGQEHVLPMAGNDEGAKQVVSGLLEELGWLPHQILDLGDLTAARGTEAYLALWVRLMQKLGTGNFNISIVHDGYADSE